MEVIYEPIAVFKCNNSKSYAAPRQGVLAKNSSGVITLNPNITSHCIEDLQGFTRIWLIYHFHGNKSWKPKVRPPRGSSIKRGVFSTRSPYRPNSIGISCVRLIKVEGPNIYVSEFDLLDGTPILDIKPYLPYADSFPQSEIGWVREFKRFKVEYTEPASLKIQWLEENLNESVFETIQNQLEYEPISHKAKRVKKLANGYMFSLQAWRIPFTVVGDKVLINDLLSGYNQADLAGGKISKSETQIHNEYNHNFNNS